MQFGKLSVSTADLTRSFGWDQYGALMQEDVHEFNKILCDALEEKMKACPASVRLILCAPRRRRLCFRMLALSRNCVPCGRHRSWPGIRNSSPSQAMFEELHD